MLNMLTLVGRIVSDLEINETEKGNKIGVLKLAVPRTFKNENGEYDTDFIPVILNGDIAKNTAEYCKKGDMVGVKGKIQCEGNEIEIIAERVTFLTSKRNDK